MTVLLCLRITNKDDVWQAITQLASILARAGLRTVLVNLSKMPGLVAVPCFSEAFTNPFADMDKLLAPTAINNLWYGELRSPVDDANEADLAGNLLHLNVDYVIMAADPMDGPAAKAVLQATDYILPFCGEGSKQSLPIKTHEKSVGLLMIEGATLHCEGVSTLLTLERDLNELSGIRLLGKLVRI